MKTSLTMESVGDAELVELCLRGDRHAFGAIIARYQSLICALAYSGCGDRGRSEDLAQDTFVTAWKDLRGLQEPAKLKSWLCGIARNLLNNTLRREQRTPIALSGPLSPEEHCGSESPHELVASKEEESLVWQALQAMPPEYREPLVLFYREGQSAQAVAAALDLSEDAVCQRLSRGRKALHERVLALVEGTMARTSPGKVFTLSVLAALPAFSVSARAATIGATATKGSAVAKGAAAVGLFSLLLGQLLVFFGNYYGYRASIAGAQSDAERAAIKTFFHRNFLLTLGLFIPFAAWVLWAGRLQNGWSYLHGLVPGLLVIYILVTSASFPAMCRRRRQYLSDLVARNGVGDLPAPVWEFRSRWSLFGLPLVHIRIGDRFGMLRGPVKAWLAAGDHAVGVLFALGGLAIAPFSIGFFAIGLLPFGALALGLVAIGGVSLGVWSYGGLAIGWQAMGGCALGWDLAYGNLALAHNLTMGNDAASRHLLRTHLFFRGAVTVDRYFLWVNLLWVIPMMIQSRILSWQRRRQDQAVA